MFRKIILSIVSILMLSLLMSACHNAPADNGSGRSETPPTSNRPDYMKDPDNIDSVLALKLREDFIAFLHSKYPDDAEIQKWTIDDIWVQKYFGNYSGCEMVFMGALLKYNQAELVIEVAGYEIKFTTYQEVLYYKDSKFYTLNEAYDAELLIKEDIYEIGKQVDLTFLERHPNP